MGATNDPKLYTSLLSKVLLHVRHFPKIDGKFAAVATDLNGTAQKINTPDNYENFLLTHVSEDEIIWTGGDSSITVAGLTAWPILENGVLSFAGKKSNLTEIYGVTDGSTVRVYVLGIS